jgi:DNA-binding NarL/FixJ family response regulator
MTVHDIRPLRRSYNEEHETHNNPFGLTNLQVQTIQLVANGYAQADVARLLHISLGAVKERMTMIRAKMDVDTSLQAAVLWIREVEFAEQQAA